MKTISIPEGLLTKLYPADASDHYVRFFGEEIPLTTWCQDIDPDVLNRSSFMDITEICKDYFSLPLTVVENSADGTRSSGYNVYGEIKSTLHRILDRWYLKSIEFAANPVRTAEQLQSAIPVIDKYHIVDIMQYKDLLSIVLPAIIEPSASEESNLHKEEFSNDLLKDLPMISYRGNVYYLCVNGAGAPIYVTKMVTADLSDGCGCQYYAMNWFVFYSTKRPHSEKTLNELTAIMSAYFGRR